MPLHRCLFQSHILNSQRYRIRPHEWNTAYVSLIICPNLSPEISLSTHVSPNPQILPRHRFCTLLGLGNLPAVYDLRSTVKSQADLVTKSSICRLISRQKNSLYRGDSTASLKLSQRWRIKRRKVKVAGITTRGLVRERAQTRSASKGHLRPPRKSSRQPSRMG